MTSGYARSMRARHLLSLPLVAIVALALAAAASISPAPAASGARASATAYEREGPSGTRGLVEARGDGEDEALGTGARSSVASGTASAEASARAEAVNLFSGLVTAGLVETRAKATNGGTVLRGSVSELAIEGRSVGSPTRPHTYSLAGHGSLAVLKQGEHGIAGLRARLTRPYRGHEAGATVTVAYSSAEARDGAPAARERRPAREPTPTGRGSATRRSRRAPPAPRRREAPELDALRTTRGYAFPVHAGYSYSNDWGAPRQHTGKHEGNDIFAPTGTPVLAVADGRLSRVGTRKIPGNRLWLKTEQGDTLFYGHLSAFAEDARNGAEVRAGDVVGFVGSTGDAERTPPHLHFEIHPRGGEATNPYPFLRAWEARRDVPPAAWLERYATDPGSRPGSLVVIEDYLAH